MTEMGIQLQTIDLKFPCTCSLVCTNWMYEFNGIWFLMPKKIVKNNISNIRKMNNICLINVMDNQVSSMLFIMSVPTPF